MNKSSLLLSLLTAFSLMQCARPPKPAVQIPIDRISGMPDHPSPYKLLNWHELALQYDACVFDATLKGEFLPLIWKDDSKRNFNQETFGLYTVMGDIRQGAERGKEFHEALNSMGALVGAGLAGIDKNQKAPYVRMVQNYFNKDNGWGIMMNNTNPQVANLGGGYGRDWWYDVIPNVLFYGVCDLFPTDARADSLQKSIADKFYAADSVLNGNYDFSFFDYKEMKGMNNQIPRQQDAAAGHAYVLLCASKKFDSRYLKRAKTSLEALLSQRENRFYEILMPFGAYAAARLNAEQGTNYDVKKLIDWTFNPVTSSTGRTGWGVISERWGDYDVHGLQGSATDGGGYAFLMNSFNMAWPLVPLVKYDVRYAAAIGKWMLNVANAARFCYPYEIDDAHQWLPEKKNITQKVIAYEGIRKTDDYGKPSLKGVSPVAIGDGPKWCPGQPEESMFSLYSSSQVGIFGAIIRPTNVEQILQLNCNATDFYQEKNFPVFLYYNPHGEAKKIISSSGDAMLFDAVSRQEVKRENSSFEILPKQALLIVELPAGSKVECAGNTCQTGGKIVCYIPENND